MRVRLATALIASAAAVLGGASAASAQVSAAGAGGAASASRPTAAHPAARAAAAGKRSPSSIALPAPVSQTPLSYTPNVYQGSSCGSACPPTMVYSTAVVGSEVVVAGAFSQVCTPAATGFAQCPSTVPVTHIFAFDPSTGAIDPNFMPALDQGPVYSLVPGPNDTVYAGGNFTTVDGTAHAGVVQLSVTPGQSTDGQVVSDFNAQLDGSVHNLAVNGNALYAGGTFHTVDGVSQRAITRLNATSGAEDSSFAFTLGSPVSGTTLQVEAMSLTPDGSTLAIGGSFQTVNGQAIPRLALISTGGGIGSPATLNNWTAPVLANSCAKQHDYVKAIDFSPDGSFFVIADNGFDTAGGPAVCDATARFETSAAGTNIQPTWVNYMGGDSLHSVTVTGSVVYVGGHQRWENNECGLNHDCEANSILVDGIGAIDANTGLGLPWWHPQVQRGVGVQALTPYPAGLFPGSNGGLIIGMDGGVIAGAKHSMLGMLPLTTTGAQVPGGPVLSGMFSQGRLGGSEGSTSGTAAMCLDDQGNGTTAGTPVDIATCANSAAQNWTVQAGGVLQINGLCLDTANGGITAGTLTVLNTCNGTATTQQWLPGAGKTLVNQASGMCLEDPNASTTSGTQLRIFGCDGNIQQVWPLPVAQAPPPPPPTGSLWLAKTFRSSNVLCLTDKDTSSKPGTPAIIEECLGNASQNWTMEANGAIQFKKLCLDTAGGGTSNGTLLIGNTCDGAASQVWTPGTGQTLVNQASHKCLNDTSGTTLGTQMEIYTCNTNATEMWRVPTV